MKVKKYNIKGSTKISVIITLIILLIFIVALFCMESIPKSEAVTKTLYDCKQRVTLNYGFELKPNTVYEKNYLENIDVILNKYIKQMKASIDYNFSSSDISNLTITYKANITVEGYTGENESYLSIFKKEYPLIKKNTVNTDIQNTKLNQTVIIDYQTLNKFIKDLKKDTEIFCQAKATIMFDIETFINRNNKKILLKSSPYIIIPLDSNYSQIISNLTNEATDKIEKTTNIAIPKRRYLINLYIIISCIVLLLIVAMIVLTNGIYPSKLSKQRIRIFKKYSSRFISINHEILIDSTNIYEVETIDDLVRISDELSIPIMYECFRDYRKINKFYVLNKDNAYIFDLISNKKEMFKWKEAKSY
ncbi:DUF5305 family protein [Clostridiaceae bacterium M8S5]|nr:DUF5305 family protein [Clostridiaceae bacterium M8S5]